MYSPAVLDHYYTPRNQGRLAAPSGEGLAGSWQAGQFMRIQIQLEGDRIQAAAFETWGCVPAIACASFVTEWATGRTREEVRTLTAGELEKSLGGLPVRRRLCAALAVDALHRALEKALHEPQEGP